MQWHLKKICFIFSFSCVIIYYSFLQLIYSRIKSAHAAADLNQLKCCDETVLGQCNRIFWWSSCSMRSVLVPVLRLVFHSLFLTHTHTHTYVHTHTHAYTRTAGSQHNVDPDHTPPMLLELVEPQRHTASHTSVFITLNHSHNRSVSVPTGLD